MTSNFTLKRSAVTVDKSFAVYITPFLTPSEFNLLIRMYFHLELNKHSGGDALSMVELCLLTGFSRNTVRAAIRPLIDYGLVLQVESPTNKEAAVYDVNFDDEAVIRWDLMRRSKAAQKNKSLALDTVDNVPPLDHEISYISMLNSRGSEFDPQKNLGGEILTLKNSGGQNLPPPMSKFDPQELGGSTSGIPLFLARLFESLSKEVSIIYSYNTNLGFPSLSFAPTAAEQFDARIFADVTDGFKRDVMLHASRLVRSLFKDSTRSVADRVANSTRTYAALDYAAEIVFDDLLTDFRLDDFEATAILVGGLACHMLSIADNVKAKIELIRPDWKPPHTFTRTTYTTRRGIYVTNWFEPIYKWLEEADLNLDLVREWLDTALVEVADSGVQVTAADSFSGAVSNAKNGVRYVCKTDREERNQIPAEFADIIQR